MFGNTFPNVDPGIMMLPLKNDFTMFNKDIVIELSEALFMYSPIVINESYVMYMYQKDSNRVKPVAREIVLNDFSLWDIVSFFVVT